MPRFSLLLFLIVVRVPLLEGNVVLLPFLLDAVRCRGPLNVGGGLVLCGDGGGGGPSGGQVTVRDVVGDPLMLRARLLSRRGLPLLGLKSNQTIHV